MLLICVWNRISPFILCRIVVGVSVTMAPASLLCFKSEFDNLEELAYVSVDE